MPSEAEAELAEELAEKCYDDGEADPCIFHTYDTNLKRARGVIEAILVRNLICSWRSSKKEENMHFKTILCEQKV